MSYINYPTVQVDSKDKVFVSFYINNKRYRLYNSNRIGGDFNPNSFPDDKRIEMGNVLAYKIYEHINKGGNLTALKSSNLICGQLKDIDYITKEGEEVISCDISNVPLDDNKVDVAVFSLSLMGSNYEEYLKESYRILKPYGNLFIAEPKKKGERILPDLKKHLTRIGFKIVDDYYSSNFLYIDCVKS